MSHNEYAQQMAYDKEQGGAAEMLTIPWVAKNAELIDFSKEAIDRSNEPDTEPESDTDYDTDDLPSDSEEEEKDCCQWCEQTDIELCSDCGDCADPSKPHRCCECEKVKMLYLLFAECKEKVNGILLSKYFKSNAEEFCVYCDKKENLHYVEGSSTGGYYSCGCDEYMKCEDCGDEGSVCGSPDGKLCPDCWEEVCEPSMRLVNCDFCGKEEDPDEIIKGTEGDACGECRHLCDKVELTE